MKILTRQHYFSIAVFTLILSLFICSLPQRMPNEDEAVIAGHAYSYDQLGFVKSDLYGGICKVNMPGKKDNTFTTNFLFLRVLHLSRPLVLISMPLNPYHCYLR